MESTGTHRGDIDGLRAIVILLLIVSAALIVQFHNFSSAKPKLIRVAESASLLYYNAPAALQMGDRTYVGYITSRGSIEVSAIDTAGRTAMRTLIHQFTSPDDHAAPALWPSDDDGLWVATARHGSDLFLYRMTVSGDVERACVWKGRFTYPRFVSEGGRLKLYVRWQDPDGHLAKIDVATGCNEPPYIVEHAAAGQVIFATRPQGRTAWSLNDESGHSGAFIDGLEISLVPSDFTNNIVTPVSDRYLAVSRFSGRFGCCNSNVQVIELYDDDGRHFTTDEMAVPYYPGGLTIKADSTELLLRGSDNGLSRRSLPSMSPLPSCGSFSSNLLAAHYVDGNAGSYVWATFSDTFNPKDLGTTSVWLCLQ